jgi:hypothetical protein
MPEAPSDRVAQYIQRVTQGEGFMPWQDRSAVSDDEHRFRADVEERKYSLLGAVTRPDRPVILTGAHIQRIRRNIGTADWAREWYEKRRAVANEIIERGHDWIDGMIPELTSTATYSFTCPACFGIKSMEGQSESNIVVWDWRDPDTISCRRCGQRYPDAAYPETGRLVMPRSGQTLTFYLNEDERANPDDRSGHHAYKWARHPIHPSFTGMARGRKAAFMASQTETLAMMYRLDGDAAYARAGIDILTLFAQRFRNWLYHDYWESYADCDPLYAAWHDRELPIEWKRHLTTDAYKGDTANRAAMLQNYWGAGRLSPSTGSIGQLDGLCTAYDLLFDATGEDGAPLWSPEQQNLVERDLILEWMMEAEPYLGGPGHADLVNNKSPRIYATMATVARSLGITEFADTALLGYEAVRDDSFGFDGFSHESPAYNMMYLGTLLQVPERLHGFHKSDGETVDLYATDPKLYLMMRCMTDMLRPDSRLPTLSDTREVEDPGELRALSILEMAARRYPEYFADLVSAIYRLRGVDPTDYAVQELDAALFSTEGSTHLDLPETWYPEWMTGFLRHGTGAEASMLTLSCNPPGGHRHNDNLSLYYIDKGRTTLGDQGYLSSAPMQQWIHATHSHNLVIVDDAEQIHNNPARVPRLNRMVTSPRMSVIDASSACYEQCSNYRRTVALVKGPADRSFCIDVFRVTGGSKHAWRVFSEIGANDASGAAMSFDGIDLPDFTTMPDYGASQSHEHLYGLRDVISTDDASTPWKAVWSENGAAQRLWMLTGSNRVEASHGPGQETWEQVGRRVRYLDVVNEGSDVTSTFVALHETALPTAALATPYSVDAASADSDARFAIRNAELVVPENAGPDALALRIESEWGTLLVMLDFDHEEDIDGVRFKGDFGTIGTDAERTQWLFASGASTLLTPDGLGFEGEPAMWSGSATRTSSERIETGAPLDGWPGLPEEVTAHVIVDTGELVTGLPVAAVDASGIAVDRFPVPEMKSFRLDAVHYTESA